MHGKVGGQVAANFRQRRYEVYVYLLLFFPENTDISNAIAPQEMRTSRCLPQQRTSIFSLKSNCLEGERHGQQAAWFGSSQGGAEKTPHAGQNPPSQVILPFDHIVRPPSTTITCPVINVEPSARKAMASAISSGVAARRMGVISIDFST